MTACVSVSTVVFMTERVLINVYRDRHMTATGDCAGVDVSWCCSIEV